MPKHTLRSQLLAHRRALSHHEWLVSSRAAQQQLLALEEYRQAASLALYAPAHNETDTTAILTAAFETGKRVFYPAVCGQQMVFRLVTGLDTLQTGRFGILEPCPSCSEHGADEADLVVVPGVGFDVNGHRIGYGKGFYDRFLHHSGRIACLVGLCHDFQLITGSIPVDPHDIPMEIIVTATQIIRCRSNRS